MRKHKLYIVLPMISLVSLANALEPLDDSALSAIEARDGLVIEIASSPDNGLSYDSLRWVADEGEVNEANLQLATSASAGGERRPGFYNVDEQGQVQAGAVHFTNTLDVGADAQTGTPYLSYQLDIAGQPDADGGSRARLMLGELSHGGSQAYGSWALDGQGTLQIAGEGGLFNSQGMNTRLFGELRNGRMYYRQVEGGRPDTAYLILDNMQARWDMPRGTLGITPDGLRMATDGVIDVVLDVDLFHKTGGPDFTAGGLGMMHFGWLGGLSDPEILWRAKGAAGAATPGLINLSTRWNYVPAGSTAGNEFRWLLGETSYSQTPADGHRRVRFEISDWATWGGHDYGHDFPVIALDMINGDRTAADAYALRWGGQDVNLEPGRLGASTGEEGLALLIRDGNLQAYSRRINLIEEAWNAQSGRYELVTLKAAHPAYSDRTADGVTRSLDWGLIYTFANVNANLMLYPGGNPDNPNKGLRGDVLVMSESFDPDASGQQGFNWDHGSHLMIADTNMDGSINGAGKTRNALGMGLMSTSFLVMADDLNLYVKPVDGSDYRSGGIDLFSPRVRVAVHTTFGGGILPDANGSYGNGPRFVRGAVIQANLEGAAHARFSPLNDQRNALGYHWGARLMAVQNGGNTGYGGGPMGSFISFAEPSRPDVAITLGQVTGDLAFANGEIDIVGHDQDAGGRPKLVFSHDLLIGNTAKPALDAVPGMPSRPNGQGSELAINRITLGGGDLGRIVMPGGRAHASIAIEPMR